MKELIAPSKAGYAKPSREARRRPPPAFFGNVDLTLRAPGIP
jgi:hypothetical protein